MRKLVICLLPLFLMFSLVSCDKEKTVDAGKIEANQYLYTNIGGVLHRISSVTASVTPMCPDPLCFHADESCCFYGLDEAGIQWVGKDMYYLKDETDSIGMNYYTKVCRFDTEDGKYEILYEPENGTLVDLFATEQYLYFSLVIVNEERKSEYYIYRYNLEEEKTECLTAEPLWERQTPYNVKDGRVYWNELMADSYYSTDLAYEDRRENDRAYSSAATMGKCVFREERSGFDQESFTDLLRLIRIDTETGEEKVIFEQLGCFPILYGGKIIYAKLGEPKLLGLMYDEETGEAKPHYDKWGGKYYICDSDGSNERLLCDLSEIGCAVPGITGLVNGERGVGDWIAVAAYRYTEPDKNGIIERTDNVYLLINIVTGEVKVAEVETRS